MTDEDYTEQPRGLGAKAKDLASGAGEVWRSAASPRRISPRFAPT